jgi:hypothetical protein
MQKLIKKQLFKIEEEFENDKIILELLHNQINLTDEK